MKKLLFLLLFCTRLIAQTQGLAPQVVDSFYDASQMSGGTGGCSGNANCVNFEAGVLSGDQIICHSVQEDVTDGCNTGGSGANPQWTFSDNVGTFTWVNETAANAGSGTAKIFAQAAYACITSNQATYRVTRSGANLGNCSTHMACMRAQNVCSGGTVTQDAFQSNVFTPGGAIPVQTLTNTLTTTRFNDFSAIMMDRAPGNGGSNRGTGIGALSFSVNQAIDQGTTLMGWHIAGTLGSNTFTTDEFPANHNSDIMQTIAFQIPIALGDSALPQGGVSTFYSAQLHCYGGTSATPTYSLFSGSMPPGLSLATSTGVISGTPTSTAAPSLTFKCTDGVTTSAPDTMTLTVVGNLANSITQVATQNSGSGNLGNPGTITFSGAQCGDVITIQALATKGLTGPDTLQIINGSNDAVTSSDSSPVQRYFGNAGGGGTNAGNNGVAVVGWVVGPILTTASQTITVKNGIGVTGAIAFLGTQLRGAQAVLDAPVINNTVATSNGSLSSNYTTVVPGEYLEVATVTNATANGGDALTLSSPFTADFTATAGATTLGTAIFGHQNVASAGTVTETTNWTNAQTNSCNGANYCEAITTFLTAIRPGQLNPCAPATSLKHLKSEIY